MRDMKAGGRYPPLQIISSKPGVQTTSLPYSTYSISNSFASRSSTPHASARCEDRYEQEQRESKEGPTPFSHLRVPLENSMRRAYPQHHQLSSYTAAERKREDGMADDEDDFEDGTSSSSPSTAKPTASRQSNLSFSSHSPSSSSFFRSSSPSFSDHTRFSGMRNVGGNSCYMNAILQALFAQSSFTSSLLQPLPSPLPHDSLYACLVALVRLHGEEDHGVIDPEPLKFAIGSRLKRFAGNRQQDAHEFLMEALNALTEDIVDSMEKQWRKQKQRSNSPPPSHLSSNSVTSALTSTAEAIEADSGESMAIVPSSLDWLLGDDVTIISDESGKENHSPRPTSMKPPPPPPAPPLSPPPVELLRQWQAEASELSAAQQSFHCEVEVTLCCANAACAHTRSNVEHFSALSLDLPEEEQGQMKINSFFQSPTHSKPPTLLSLSSSSTSSSPLSTTSSSSLFSPPNSNLANCLRTDADKARGSTPASASSTGFSPASSALPLHFLSSSSSRDLPRPSLPSLVSLLRSFFSPSLLEYRCERCHHSHVRITSKLSRLPRVLILHIKRFTPDPITGRNQKRADQVSVQRIIDLTPLCTDNVQRPSASPPAPHPTPPKLPAELTKLVAEQSGANGSSRPQLHLPSTPRSERATVQQPSMEASGAVASSRAVSASSSRNQPGGRRSMSPSSVPTASAASSSSLKRSRVDNAFSVYDYDASSVCDYVEESKLPFLADGDDSGGSKRPRRAAADVTVFSSQHDREWVNKRGVLELEREHRVGSLVHAWQAKKAQAAAGALDDPESIDEQHQIAVSVVDADIDARRAQLKAEEEKENKEWEERLRRRKRAEADGEVAEPVAALDDDEGDEELQKALELSKTDTHQRNAVAVEEDEEAQFQRALKESMQGLPVPMVDGLEDDAELSTLSTTSTHAHGRTSPPRLPATPTSVATTLSPASDSSAPPARHLPVPVPPTPSTPASSLSPSSQPSPIHYALNGVVLHKGVFSTSGHYVTDLLVKDKGGREEGWKRYDDQYVNALDDGPRLKKTWESEGYIFFFTLQPS